MVGIEIILGDSHHSILLLSYEIYAFRYRFHNSGLQCFIWNLKVSFIGLDKHRGDFVSIYTLKIHTDKKRYIPQLYLCNMNWPNS